MSDPIGALRGVQQGGDVAKHLIVDLGKDPNGPSFGDTLKRALGEVSEAQDTAADYMQRFMRGEPVELHQVMAATEEAGIALELLVEMRNKFTDAYRAITNMQS